MLAWRSDEWIEGKGIISEFQVGFREGRKTTDNVFILRRIIDKYITTKRGEMYWLLVDLQKAFGTVVREASQWNLGKKRHQLNLLKE